MGTALFALTPLLEEIVTTKASVPAMLQRYKDQIPSWAGFDNFNPEDYAMQFDTFDDDLPTGPLSGPYQQPRINGPYQQPRVDSRTIFFRSFLFPKLRVVKMQRIPMAALVNFDGKAPGIRLSFVVTDFCACK